MKKTTLKLSFLISIISTLFLFSCSSIQSEVLSDGVLSNISHNRGLDVDQDKIIIAGSKGNVSFLNMRGNEFNHALIDSAEDIRDVEIISQNHILLLNSGDNGIIYKIDSIGQVTKVFNEPGIFLDGMAFWDDQYGIAYGDPIDGRIFMIKTKDGGNSWSKIDLQFIPFALPNEAGFAASGTGIQCVGESTCFIGTGACDTARLFRTFDKGTTWDVVNTPMTAGESFGIYAMYFWNETEGIIIGGSYLEKEYKKRICFYTDDAGETWFDRSKGLSGYCSGIHGNKNASLVVATGRQGTFYSLNKGLDWKLLTKDKFYSVKVTDSLIILSGNSSTYKIFQYTLQVID